MDLAPAILEVEYQVHRRQGDEVVNDQELRDVFTRARDYLLRSDALFQHVRETLLTDELGEQKLVLAGQEMLHTRACLDRLEEVCLTRREWLLQDRLNNFQSSARQCLALFAEFTQLAAQQPIYSPSPPFDAFLKMGIKHLEGGLPKKVVEHRFLELGRELERFQRLVKLLPKLHRIEPALVESLEKSLRTLETGVGALMQWRERDDQVALVDGLRLLGSATTNLVQELEAAETVCAAQTRHTTFRALEIWLRLCEYAVSDSTLPSAWIQASANDVLTAWSYLLIQGDELLRHPLLADQAIANGLSLDTWSAHPALRHRVDRELQNSPPQDWIGLPDTFWRELIPSLESLSSQVSVSHRALELALEPFRELPSLERLAVLKERVKRGQLGADILVRELERQVAKAEELIASVEEAQDPISAEFRDLLPIHRSAYLGMLENLRAQNFAGVDKLWQAMLMTLPHLVGLSRSIAQRLARQSSNAMRIPCLRCSASNPPERRVCESCGANLVAVVQRAQISTELLSPTTMGNTVSPSRAHEMLEALVRGIEANTVTRRQTGAAIDALLANIDEVRQDFASKVLPLIGTDPTLDVYLRFFAQAMGAYTAALKQMHAFSDGASLAQLHSGLAECRETLNILDELKARIDESLRG